MNDNWIDVDVVHWERVEDDPETLSVKDKSLSHVQLEWRVGSRWMQTPQWCLGSKLLRQAWRNLAEDLLNMGTSTTWNWPLLPPLNPVWCVTSGKIFSNTQLLNLLFDHSNSCGSLSLVSLHEHARPLIIWPTDLSGPMVSLYLFTDAALCTLASHWSLSIPRLLHLQVYLELHAFLT